jgi:hypothetical protein
MNLEVGEQIVCKNAGRNGECVTVKVVGISKDSQDMTYIMATRLGTYFQVKSHNVCVCNNIDACSLRRTY